MARFTVHAVGEPSRSPQHADAWVAGVTLTDGTASRHVTLVASRDDIRRAHLEGCEEMAAMWRDYADVAAGELDRYADLDDIPDTLELGGLLQQVTHPGPEGN